MPQMQIHILQNLMKYSEREGELEADTDKNSLSEW